MIYSNLKFGFTIYKIKLELLLAARIQKFEEFIVL